MTTPIFYRSIVQSKLPEICRVAQTMGYVPTQSESLPTSPDPYGRQSRGRTMQFDTANMHRWNEVMTAMGDVYGITDDPRSTDEIHSLGVIVAVPTLHSSGSLIVDEDEALDFVRGGLS